MKLTFLGTGTSHGIPVIGCDCHVCASSDPHDKRLRSSVYIECDDGLHILIDCGPEFRIQALREKIKKIDAVLLTHSHADHLHGIDDLRIFSSQMWKKPTNEKSLEQYNAPPLPIYSNEETLHDFKERFSYLFVHHDEGGGVAKIQLEAVSETFSLGTTAITPIPMMHGHLPTVGWLLSQKKSDGKIHSMAYLTDCSFISDESIELLKEKGGIIDQLIIDGLRIREHSTHFSFLEAMSAAEKIGGRHLWFTHMTHECTHEEIIFYINEHIKEFPGLEKMESVLPAYDGLVIEV